MHLNKPIFSMVATKTGKGRPARRRVTAACSSFGDARFFGSTGNLQLRSPIVGITGIPTGKLPSAWWRRATAALRLRQREVLRQPAEPRWASS